MEVIAKSDWPRERNLNSGVLLTPLDLVRVIILLVQIGDHLHSQDTETRITGAHCLESQAIE